MRYWPQKPVLGVPVNWGDPLAPGLLGCWLMNEGTGNKVYDLSGNENTGIFTGDGNVWQPGKFGSCVYTPDSADYITLPRYDLTSGFTFVVWFYLVALPSGDYETDYIINEYVDASNNLRLTIRNMTGGNFYTEVEITYGGAVTKNSLPIVSNPEGNGRWVQFVVTWDKSNQRVYTDTKLRDTDAATSNFTQNIGLRWVGYSANVKFDHVMIYNHALSASEIAQLYLKPFGMFRRPSIELWSAMQAVAGPSVSVLAHQHSMMAGAL